MISPSPPAESIAAMVRALPAHAQPSIVFRDAASAILRMNRTRGRVECDALGLIFEDDSTPDDRRVLILDLLACAGTPEAQVVMRRLLALGVARRCSRTFATYVQRLGFVEQPDIATVRFLFSVYAESRYEAADVRAACAYALGAAAGRANAAGLIEAAQFVSETLRRDLGVALEGPEKCALLAALGNVGLEADVSVIVHLANDPDPRVRGAAALALRKTNCAEARAALLMLLTGANVSVAESALSALFGQTLEEGEIVRLAELVLDGRTALALDGRILRLIVTQKISRSSSNASERSEIARGSESANDSAVPKHEDEIVERVIHVLLSRIEARNGASEGDVESSSPALAPSQPPASKSGKFPRVQVQALSSGTELPALHPIKRNSTQLKTVFEPQIAARMNALANSKAEGTEGAVVITEKASSPFSKKFASTILQGSSNAIENPPSEPAPIEPAPIFVVDAAPRSEPQAPVIAKRQPFAQTMVQRDDIKSKVACSINVPIVELAVRRIRRSAP